MGSYLFNSEVKESAITALSKVLNKIEEVSKTSLKTLWISSLDYLIVRDKLVLSYHVFPQKDKFSEFQEIKIFLKNLLSINSSYKLRFNTLSAK